MPTKNFFYLIILTFILIKRFPLDMFESRTSGIFTLLDEECRMPNPQMSSFMQKVISIHERCSAFSLFRSNKAFSQNTQCGFVIRHFGHNVFYATVNNSFYSIF